MAANRTSRSQPVIAADRGADAASPRFSRLEDDRLLQGEGRFLANLRLDGMLHAAIVRSQHAHARLKEVAVGEAAACIQLVQQALQEQVAPRRGRRARVRFR